MSEDRFSPRPDHANRDVVDFENFEFGNLGWKKKKFVSADIEVDTSSATILYEDFVIQLEGKKELGLNDSIIYKFEFTNRSSWVFLETKLSNFDTESIDCISNVTRHGKDDELPKAFARKCYRKMLQYIQFLAHTTHKKITHLVRYDSLIPYEKWLEIFGSLFQEFGYELQSNGQDWQHVYVPKK